MRKGETLTSRQKAAVMLMCMGSDAAGHVIRHLAEEEVEALTLEVARLDRVAPEHRENVIN